MKDVYVNDGGETAVDAPPISEWQVADQPRDKIFQIGSGRMSDAELVGLVLGSGVRTRNGSLNAIDLARQLLNRFGSLHGLSLRDAREFATVEGVGQARAAQLAAVLEIARRIEAHPGVPRVQVCSPEDVVSVFGPGMRSLQNEIFRVVLLNTANYIISERTISEGGLAASIVEPRAIFRQAILDNAAAIVCLHNHPSGNPEPSQEDIRVTRQLVHAGQVMGVPLHDHIIIAGKRYTSLAERGYV
ncbi:MAG: DNA repair protein RadC [Rhodothermales bacterium]